MSETETDVSAAEAQEIEANAGHYVAADLCGKRLRVVPPGAWRQSWQRKLRQGDFDGFAEEVFHPDDVDTYFDLDPTNDDFGAFVEAAARAGGEDLGKSSGPRASSRSTRKR